LNYRRRSTGLKLVFAILGVLIISTVLTWGNYAYAREKPGGNDFMIPWLATRLLITRGVSPYSIEATSAIGNFAYGYPAKSGEQELSFNDPLYSVALYVPFALIPDYLLARALWMTLLEWSLVLLAVFSMKTINWKPGPLLVAVFFIFSLSWFHSLYPLASGDVSILIALLLIGGLWAIKNHADELAGVLLAFSTIKPEVGLLLIVFILVWSIANKRWRIVTWIPGTILLLTLSGVLLIPDWLLQFTQKIILASNFPQPFNFSAALQSLMPGLGERIALGVTGVLVIILIIEWRTALKNKFRGFLWASVLTLVASQWIGIPTSPVNFIILLPGIVLTFQVLEERWQYAGKVYAIASMVLLSVGIWWMYEATLNPAGNTGQLAVLFLPVPGFLLLTLYWIRWWTFQTPRYWLDEILDGKTILD
jgi:hypothetical protein